MRVLLTLLYMCTVSVSLGMRLIPIDVRRSSDFLGNSAKLIPLEDRRIYLNNFYELRTTNERNKQRKIDELSNEMHKKYKDELTFEERINAVECIYRVINVWSVPDSYLDEYMQMSMNLPYVRESATGLAVEALIKRLENIHILEIFERPIYTKDTSVLRIFIDEALASVQLMNNEWLAHNDNPEYDHGAPMYWFADLDNELEFSLRRIEPILNKIANQWISTENRKKARQVLYDWREYISPTPK